MTTKQSTIINMRVSPLAKAKWQAQADEETNGNLTQWIESQCNNAVTLESIDSKLTLLLARLKSIS